MQSLTLVLVIALGAYLIGSLSFAVIVARLMNLPDPRSHGSGNPGATNMLRTGKKAAAFFTLLGDSTKGWLAVWLAGLLAAKPGIPLLATHAAALGVFLGHLYPVFFGFRGGKGVATALGILLALNPWLGLATLVVWVSVFTVTRLSSLAALAASISAPFIGLWLNESRVTVLMLCLIIALLIWRHRSNIQRLLAGKESRFKKAK